MSTKQWFYVAMVFWLLYGFGVMLMLPTRSHGHCSVGELKQVPVRKNP